MEKKSEEIASKAIINQIYEKEVNFLNSAKMAK